LIQLKTHKYLNFIERGFTSELKEWKEENMFIFGERVEGVSRIQRELHEGKRGYLG
jgi:hypothetical protein